MIKRIIKGAVAAFIAVTLLFSFSKVQAGIPVGTWRLHPAYNNATHSIYAFDKVFVLSDGSLYYYEPEYEALYTIDKTGGLSDAQIAVMAYCNVNKALMIVYSNGNIDLLYEDETIYNFTDLKNNSVGDLTIYQVVIDNSKAYISTTIGLVIFDIKKREIKNRYVFDSPVYTSVLTGDSIICGTADGIYAGNSSQNLLDKTNWNLLRNIAFNELFIFDNQLCGVSYDNNVWTINRNNGGLNKISDRIDGVSYLSNNRIALIKDTIVSIYNSIADYKNYIFPYHVNHIMSHNDDYWVSHGVNGVYKYSLTNGSLKCVIQGIKPNSPRYNMFHSVSWPQQDKLMVVSGCHNYAGINYPGAVMFYENDRWSYLQDDVSSITGLKYINLTEAVQDPLDPNHIFVGSTGQGLYEFKNNMFYKLHTWDNSELTSILSHHKYDYVRISALQYDRYGNLWMANNETDTIIKVMEPDGKWFSLYYPDISGIPTFKQLRFDSNGKAWLISTRGIKPGIVCIDCNGTPKNNKDDKIRLIDTYFTNQDGLKEEVTDIFCYDFDKNGDIWIGTNIGIFVLKQTDNFITNSNPIFERIKIPRNDGSNLADYLFNNVLITALFIDQGNRKWIGTFNNGVFLMSADGTETLEHFTASNSPLPSDNIISITNNGSNGSLFFGTSLGIAEYGGQARDPQESLSESNLLVYPNPVKPEYDEYVTITGLTEGSFIIITSNSGRLINQGVSNGGSYSWNLTNTTGSKVSSGVYHALITNSDKSKSESIMITIIR